MARSACPDSLAPGAEPPRDLTSCPFVSYFEARSPDTLSAPSPWRPPAGPVRAPAAEGLPGAPVPIVARHAAPDVDGDGRLEIVACDMGPTASSSWAPRRRPGSSPRSEGPEPRPRHDGGPRRGRPPGPSDRPTSATSPEDHEKGSVVWLRGKADALGEARPRREAPPPHGRRGGRFRRRGDLDLVGRRRPLHPRRDPPPRTDDDWTEPQLVRGRSTSGRRPQRPRGRSRRGRRPDFVALLGSAARGRRGVPDRGGGRSRRGRLRGPDAAWGSTGIEMVDFDRAPTFDVLMTNGRRSTTRP